MGTTSTVKRAAINFAFGAMATVPMTGVFLTAKRAGLVDEIPPHKAIRSVAPQLKEPRLSVISTVAHFLVGATAGAFYGALVPTRLIGVLTGSAFGVAVWVIGYEAVMPAATDIAPAHRDSTRRAGTILVAHLVYGVALGTLMVLRRGTQTAR